MRFWRRLSLPLVFLLLATQFAGTITPQARAGGDHQASSAQSPSRAEIPGAAIAAAPAEARPNEVRAQAGNIPATVNARIRPFNGNYVVIPTVVDDRDWPTVRVSIFNPNAFWVAIQVQSTSEADVVGFEYPWAQFPAIPPGEEAIYTLRFDSTADSTVSFYVEGAALFLPTPEEPASDANVFGGGFFTLANYILTATTGGLVPLDRLLVLSTSSPEDIISNLMSSLACSRFLESNADIESLRGAGMWGWVQDAYRCVTSLEMETIISALLKSIGEGAPLKKLGPLLAVADVFADMFVSFYQLLATGSSSATVTFESVVGQFGKVRVRQVDEGGNPIPGGCYTLRISEDESSPKLGYACDDSDGTLDGIVTIGSKPGGRVILGNTYAPAGYVAPSDRSVDLVRDEIVDVPITLETGTAVAISVVDGDGEPVVDACFRLIPALPDGELVACDRSDGTKDGRVVFDRVGAGQYTLTQTVVPFDHAGAEDQVITIVKGVPQSITVVNAFNGYGSLVINLRGEDGSLPLGACFDVFNTNSDPRLFIARLCDDVDGTLRIDPLVRGSYLLVQVATPTGYVSIADYPFTIIGGQVTTLDIQNRFPGTLRIRNVDEQGAIIGGGCFWLDQNVIGVESRCDSNGDGVVLIENLRPGTYRLQQTRTPSGHSQAPELVVTIEALETTSVDMVSWGTSMLVVRTVSEGGEAIPGACFDLADDLGNGVPSTWAKLRCDSDDRTIDGETTFSYLEPGAYVLVDYRTPQLFQVMENRPIVIPETPGVFEVEIVLKFGGAAVITTVDTESGYKASARFAVYENVGGAIGDQLPYENEVIFQAGSYTTRIDHMAPGEYWLRQTTGSDGRFIFEEHIPLTITAAAETPVTVQNTPWPTLIIRSTNQAGELIPGACYSNNLWPNISRCDASDGTLDGLTFVRRIKPGTHEVKQVQPLDGYLLAATRDITIPAEPGVIEVTIEHAPGGVLLISTVDDETGAPVWPCYSIYDRSSGLDVRVGGSCGNPNETGVQRIEGLPVGNFVLRQTSGVDYYKVLLLAEDIPITITAGTETQITVRNKPWPTLILESRNQAGELVPGACYDVWRPYDTGLAYSPCDSDDGVNDGIARVSRIQPRAYMLTPSEAPSGYALVAPAGEITIPKLPEPIEMSFIHAPGGAAIVTTIDDETNELAWSTCFAVYHDNGGVRGDRAYMGVYRSGFGTICTQNQGGPPGTLTIAGLEPGAYLLEQVSEPWGYKLLKLDEDIPFTITAGGETSITVRDQPWPTLIIRSTSQTNEPLPGACYRLWNLDQWADWKSFSSCDADDGANDGITTIRRIAPGTFSVIQNQTPAGHVLAAQGEITVPAEPGVVDVSFAHLPAGAVVVERRNAQGVPLSGACFTVYQNTGDGDLGSQIAQTCEGNPYRIDGLLPGNYVLRETRAPGGESPTPNILFSIVARQDTNIWIGGEPVATPTPSPTLTATPSPTATPITTVTPTATATPTTTVTPTATATPIVTPTATPTSTPTVTPSPTVSPAPVATISSARMTVNSWVTFGLSGFPANASIRITWTRMTGSIIDIDTVQTDASGNATGQFRVPATPGGARQEIRFTTGSVSASVFFEVVPRIKVLTSPAVRGEEVNVSLRGYGRQEAVRIRWRQPGGAWIDVAQVTTSNTGSANVMVAVPMWAVDGEHSVRGDGTTFRQQTNAVFVQDSTEPRPPIADAGPDQSVEFGLITLDGSGSSAPGGTIIRYVWTNGSTEIATGVKPVVSLPAGTHTITLTVTSSNGLTSSDTVVVAMIQTNGTPAVTLTPARTTVNNWITYTIEGYPANATVQITWKRLSGSTIDLGTAQTDAAGFASGQFRAPATPGGPNQEVAFSSGGISRTALFEVVPRIKVLTNPGVRGEEVNVSLRGYERREEVRIRWRQPGGTWVEVARVTTSNTGSANIMVAVPAWAPDGNNSVRGDGAVFRQQTNVVYIEGGTFQPAGEVSPSPAPTEPPVITPIAEPTATAIPSVTVTPTGTPIPTETPIATETPVETGPASPTATEESPPEATATETAEASVDHP